MRAIALSSSRCSRRSSSPCTGSSRRRRSRRRRARGRGAGLPVQERRRADQRHGDGLRRERPLRVRPAAGRLRRLRRRPAADDHALQRRAGAGQPRHRARHQRQHGRREDRGGARARSIASSSTCSIDDDEIFLYRFSNDADAAPGLDERSPAADRGRSARIIAERRHGDVRRGRRGDSARGSAASNRKKALLVISDGNDTSSTVSVRDVKQRRSARAKCWSTRSASTATARDRRRARSRRRGAADADSVPVSRRPRPARQRRLARGPAQHRRRRRMAPPVAATIA